MKMILLFTKLAIGEVIAIASFVVGMVGYVIQLDRKINTITNKVTELEKDMVKNVRSTEGQEDLIRLLSENLTELRVELRHALENLRKHEAALEKYNDEMRRFFEGWAKK